MVIIYDFDGTLTPYSLPQYEIIKKCGYNDEFLIKRAQKEIDKKSVDGFYEAYYKTYQDILFENKITMTMDNICLGADKVQFNNGVIDYFNKFQSSKTGIKHYIVTSGVQYYVEKTEIKKYVDGIYGVTFNQKDNVFENVEFLLTDKEKVNIIKKIQTENEETNQVIYFGDGLTDKIAFEYVHSIGGKNVFIVSNEQAMNNYKILNSNGIIDKCFKADFRNDLEISKYISDLIENNVAV